MAVGTSNMFSSSPWTSSEAKKTSKIFFKSVLTPGTAKRTQITAMCQGLAQVYWAIFNTQYPQEGKKVSKSDNETTAGAVAAPTTVTDTVAAV